MRGGKRRHTSTENSKIGSCFIADLRMEHKFQFAISNSLDFNVPPEPPGIDDRSRHLSREFLSLLREPAAPHACGRHPCKCYQASSRHRRHDRRRISRGTHILLRRFPCPFSARKRAPCDSVPSRHKDPRRARSPARGCRHPIAQQPAGSLQALPKNGQVKWAAWLRIAASSWLLRSTIGPSQPSPLTCATAKDASDQSWRPTRNVALHSRIRQRCH